MDLIEGISLDGLLRSSPDHRLSTKLACQLIRDVLTPLNYAHRNGIIHRDVKPSNILIDAEGSPHLTDFGIAVAAGEARRTRAGMTVGTLHYMSPEQIRTPYEIDHRTDVYSVGCLLYKMLTGRPPFIASDRQATDAEFEIKSAHLTSIPVAPRERVPSIPTALSELVMRALEKNPADRFAGCGQFRQFLDDVESDNKGPGDERLRLSRRFAVIGVVLLAVAIVVALIGTS